MSLPVVKYLPEPKEQSLPTINLLLPSPPNSNDTSEAENLEELNSI